MFTDEEIAEMKQFVDAVGPMVARYLLAAHAPPVPAWSVLVVSKRSVLVVPERSAPVVPERSVLVVPERAAPVLPERSAAGGQQWSASGEPERPVEFRPGMMKQLACPI